MPNEYLHVHTLKDFNTARTYSSEYFSGLWSFKSSHKYHRNFTIALTKIDRHDTFVI